ncbi:MAG: bifunctional nuclease domain-containing protein [Candidatus Coatesbacteria bacterium]
MTTPDLHEMTVKEIRIDGDQAAIVFADAGTGDILPYPAEPAAAHALQLELDGTPGGKLTVSSLLENTIAHLDGKFVRAEIAFSPRPGPSAHLVLSQEGREGKMPARITDAVALAHRHQVPVCATAEARQRMCVHAGETGASTATMDWNETYRLVMGFTALGRVDDAIPGLLRLRELEPSRESWCAPLGALYRKKGWLTHAAAGYAKALAWSVREGYLTSAAEIAREMGMIAFGAVPPMTLQAPAVIEDFASPQFNNEWWGAGEVVPAPGGHPGMAYRLGLDRKWMIVRLLGGHTWEGARAVCLDVFVAPEAVAAQPLPVGVSLSLAGPRQGWYHVAPRNLGPGWNRLTVPLGDPIWNEGERKALRLDGNPLATVTEFQIGMDDRPPCGALYLANIRLE